MGLDDLEAEHVAEGKRVWEALCSRADGCDTMWRDWWKQWRPYQAKVKAAFEREFPGIECLPTTDMHDGRLSFQCFVNRTSPSGGKVGEFTVPYLATDKELTELVRSQVMTLHVMAETEESLRAEALAVDACYAKDYTDPPERWKAWHRRWEPMQELVQSIAEREHPGWRAAANICPTDGRLLFIYLRTRADGVREAGGLFVVPYLADERELTRIIRRHRPNDYAAERAEAGSITWVPGGEP